MRPRCRDRCAAAALIVLLFAANCSQGRLAADERPELRRLPHETLLSDNFEGYRPGVLARQGGWARSEDLEEATELAEIAAPGLEGSDRALFLREKGQGASRALSRNVGAELVSVEFDFEPGSFKRPLTLGLRSGAVDDGVRGAASAYIKLDGGKIYHLTRGTEKWVEFEGVGWELGRCVRVRLLVDYSAKVSRIEVDGALSPTVVGNWWRQEPPGNIDITCQFGTGGSRLDNLVVRAGPP